MNVTKRIATSVRLTPDINERVERLRTRGRRSKAQQLELLVEEGLRVVEAALALTDDDTEEAP